MEPGGSHGLQNRSRPDHVGLGGFDSHALPPLALGRRRSHFLDMIVNRSLIRYLMAIVLLAAPLVAGAQIPDSARRVPTAAAIPAEALVPPISPRRAFFYSFLAPGYSQTVLGRHKAAVAFLLVEAISIGMIRESAADLHEARRSANDSVVVSYVDASGAFAIVKRPPHFGDADVHVRAAHVEDWIALLVANHLFAGADAFVAAHLWDLPARLGLRVFPKDGGAAVTAAIKW